MLAKNFVPNVSVFCISYNLVYICAFVVTVVVICCGDIMPANKLSCQFCVTHMTASDWIDEQSAEAYLYQLSSGKSLLFGINVTVMYRGFAGSCEYSCAIMYLYFGRCLTHGL